MGREQLMAPRRPRAGEPPAEAGADAALADAVQAAMAAWCARQREAMEAMTALMHALLLSQDPVRTAEAWIDWRKEALRRLTDDARDQMAVAAALVQCFGDTRLFPEHGLFGDDAPVPAGATPAPPGLRPDEPARDATPARRSTPFRSITTGP